MLKAWSPRFLSILRIVAALLFMEHGAMKLFGYPGPLEFAGGSLAPLMLVAALIELIGGGLIALGLFTRAAAFICSGQMAAAYFIAHYPNSFFPISNHGAEAILYCFLFLYLVFAGGGVWSLDAIRRGGR